MVAESDVSVRERKYATATPTSTPIANICCNVSAGPVAGRLLPFDVLPAGDVDENGFVLGETDNDGLVVGFVEGKTVVVFDGLVEGCVEGEVLTLGEDEGVAIGDC